MLNKLKYLINFSISFMNDIFFKKMPLEIFIDYDNYWQKRILENRLPENLVRYKIAIKYIGEKGRVLDVGAGVGIFFDLLKNKNPNLELIGTDISEVCLKKLKEKGYVAVYFNAESDVLTNRLKEIGIDKVEYVTVMDVLEHVFKAEELMQEIRKLNPKICIVSIPNIGYFGCRLRLLLGGKMPLTIIIYHIREHIRFWTVKDFIYWADKMGFKIKKIEGQHGFPVLWRFFPSLFASGVVFILEPKKV